MITSFAKNASVWTPRNKSVVQSVAHRVGPMTVSATTTTTTAVAGGTKVIAAATVARLISASTVRIARYARLLNFLTDCFASTESRSLIPDGPQCMDPNSSDFKKNVCLGECSHPNWAGDGVCDGGNNNCACEYDKGDCCGDSKNPNQFKFCKVNCKCVDPKAQDKK